MHQSSCYFFTLFLIGQLVQLEAACTATGIPASGEVTWTESTVPNDHFKDCDNLIKFTFSNSNNPTRIGSGSFQSTSLKSIEIPESLVEIPVFNARKVRGFPVFRARSPCTWLVVSAQTEAFERF